MLYVIYVYCCFHDVKEFNKCLVPSHDNCYVTQLSSRRKNKDRTESLKSHLSRVHLNKLLTLVCPGRDPKGFQRRPSPVE